MKKKIIFDESPKLVHYTSSNVRICFDVKEVTVPNFNEEGEQIGTKTAYQADVVYVNHPMNFENIEEQIVGVGYDKFKAEEIAAEVMLYLSNNEDVDMAKQMVVARISQYDKSDAVNQFYYQGVPMWLDKDTRAGLKLRFEAEEAAGEENTTLWYGVQSFTLPVASAKAMLNAIEMYASTCYDKTQEHKANVMAKKKVETVLAYDYTVGYPPKLRFWE